MWRFVVAAAMLCLLLFPTSADAFFWPMHRFVQVSSCYYVAPVIYVPTYTACYDPCAFVAPPLIRIPPPFPAGPGFAQPIPAGPSPSREPPLAVPSSPQKPEEKPKTSMPRVVESRFYDTFPVALRDGDRPADNRCSVGFWNLSNTDLVLKVGSQRHSLPRGKNVLLDLEREFVWHIEGREAQAEKIPQEQSALEIVIRR